MYFVKLSETRGINLDQVAEWRDHPQADPPTLHLFTTDNSGTMAKLTGQERVTLLSILESVAQTEDWKRGYDEISAEYRAVCDRLVVYREHVTDEQEKRIWDQIHAAERA
jgi:hypothetical protein